MLEPPPPVLPSVPPLVLPVLLADPPLLELEPVVALLLLLSAEPVLVPGLAVVSLPDMPCVVVGPVPPLPVEEFPLVPVAPEAPPVEPTPELLASVVVVPEPPHASAKPSENSPRVEIRIMPR